MRLKLALGIVLSWAAASTAFALQPYLVKDVNPFVTDPGSNPVFFGRIGAVALFAATTADGAQGLWRSDETEAGTYALPSPPFPQPLAFTGDRWFFYAFPNGIHDQAQLWVTDGSVAGTILVCDQPIAFTRTAVWEPVHRLLLFVAGSELWRSDGTPQGTESLLHLDLSPIGTNLVAFRGWVFFWTLESAPGTGIWRTDGTTAGTQPIVYHAAAQETEYPGLFRVAGGRMYFTTSAGDHFTLWATDGSLAGAQPVLQLGRGDAGGPRLADLTAVGGRALFVADDGVHGWELWASDGSVAGTRALRSFPASAVQNFSFPQAQQPGKLVLPLDDGRHGSEPWVTDGTANGTRLLRDVCPGRCAGGARVLGATSGSSPKLYFDASDGRHGSELWVTDGTSKGTRMIGDLCPGACSSTPFAPAALGDTFFFVATDGQQRQQLWVTTGSSRSTRELTSFSSSRPFGDIVSMVPLASSVLFAADDGQHGMEPWVSDGTVAGTRLLANVNSSVQGHDSLQSTFYFAGDGVYFFADDGSHGSALWRSDGSSAGTQQVIAASSLSPQLTPGTYPTGTVSVGDRLFFLVAGNSGSALWKTDGSAGSTVQLTPDGTSVSDLGAGAGQALIFFASDGNGEPSLWASDGSTAGTTSIVSGLRPDAFGGQKPALGGRVYFLADGDSGLELWRSDGTRAGSERVVTLDSSTTSSLHRVAPMVSFGGRIYFFDAVSSAQFPPPVRLWSTDGTASGTHLATTLGLAPTDTLLPSFMAVAGARLFIFGTALAQGQSSSMPELWVTDGTEAGTRLVYTFPAQLPWQLGPDTNADLNGTLAFIGPSLAAPTDPSASGILWLTDGSAQGTGPLHDAQGHEIGEVLGVKAFMGELVFSVGQGSIDDTRLWHSDGTTSGTMPFALPAYGAPPTVAGSKLFFPGADPATGLEPWALRP